MLDSDVVLFCSTASPNIHHQVKSLQNFKKPGLAIVQMEKDVAEDKEAIRHGSQLMKTGFPVLIKMFTPLRLFTTIDKIYLLHQLQKQP
jgi:hypothetical protein